jgi:hypothetical protein
MLIPISKVQAPTRQDRVLYLATSALLSALEPMACHGDLECWLVSRYHASQAAVLDIAIYYDITHRKHPPKNLQMLVQDVRWRTCEFRTSGMQALLVDFIEPIPPAEITVMIENLIKIWRSGIDIIISDPEHTLISFNEMSDVVNGDEFVSIYVRSVWHNQRPSESLLCAAPKEQAKIARV